MTPVAPAAPASLPPRLPPAQSPWWLLVLLPMALALFAYARWEWGSLHGFALALDHHPRLLQDFIGHYLPMAQAIDRAALPVTGYLYSAFFALLLSPLALLPTAAAEALWTTVVAGSLAALAFVSGRLALRLSWRASVGFAALSALSWPALHALKWGQVSATLAALAVGAACCARRQRPGWAGLLLGGAAAIKFYPAVLCLDFALRRDWRALRAFATVFALAYAIIPAIALGPGRWWSFEANVRAALAAGDWVTRDPNSQFAGHVVGRLLALGGAGWPTASVAAALRVASFAIAFVALALARQLRRRAQADSDLLPFVALLVATPFFVPTSWPHYFVYLPVAQVAVFKGAARGRAGTAPRALAALSALLSCAPVAARAPTWAHYTGTGMLLWADVLLLVALAVIARGASDLPAQAEPCDGPADNVGLAEPAGPRGPTDDARAARCSDIGPEVRGSHGGWSLR